MSSLIPKAVNESREDLSDYLWHFCREDRKPESTIRKILSETKILSSFDFATKANVVCLTEMPLEQVKKQLPVLRENEYTRFSSYGIGFPRELIFGNGGLPVIYQTRQHLKDLAENIRWRHVDLSLTPKRELDYTWQREWRMLGDFDFCEYTEQAIVVVPDEGAFEGEIYDIEMDGDYIDGEAVSFPAYVRHWKSISLDWIKEPITNKMIRTRII